jgi:hypothetical protein
MYEFSFVGNLVRQKSKYEFIFLFYATESNLTSCKGLLNILHVRKLVVRIFMCNQQY